MATVRTALSEEDEIRLLEAADRSKSPLIGTYVRIALLTGMRSDEIRNMQWAVVDLGARRLRVGVSKTRGGTGRVIPLSTELFEVLTRHADWFTRRFGETRPEYYLFPFGQSAPKDQRDRRSASRSRGTRLCGIPA
jgi:integrase